MAKAQKCANLVFFSDSSSITRTAAHGPVFTTLQFQFNFRDISFYAARKYQTILDVCAPCSAYLREFAGEKKKTVGMCRIEKDFPS